MPSNGDKVINGIPRCTLTPHVRVISFLFSPGGWSHLLVTIPYESKFKFAHGGNNIASDDASNDSAFLLRSSSSLRSLIPEIEFRYPKSWKEDSIVM